MDALNELKKKQNRLLLLAFENKIDRSYHFSDVPGLPTLEDLQHNLYPEHEKEIDKAIKFLEEHIITPTVTENTYPKLWKIKVKRHISFKDILGAHALCE